MSVENYMTGTTLAERQMYYYNAHKCPYCNGYTDLVDSIEVYQESHGLIYICRPCKAWVGVMFNSDQALGPLAKSSLRVLRQEAHKWYDPLWQAKVRKDNVSVKTAKGKAALWMGKILNIAREESHIGYLNNEQCHLLIEECKKHYATPEKLALRESWLKWNKDVVYWNAEDLGYTVQEFNLNGMMQLELTHHSGKVLKYKPKEKIGAWSGKKSKWIPIDDIEQFILSNFK